MLCSNGCALSKDATPCRWTMDGDFSCTICGRLFASKQALQTHVGMKHPSEKTQMLRALREERTFDTFNKMLEMSSAVSSGGQDAAQQERMNLVERWFDSFDTLRANTLSNSGAALTNFPRLEEQEEDEGERESEHKMNRGDHVAEKERNDRSDGMLTCKLLKTQQSQAPSWQSATANMQFKPRQAARELRVLILLFYISLFALRCFT